MGCPRIGQLPRAEAYGARDVSRRCRVASAAAASPGGLTLRKAPCPRTSWPECSPRLARSRPSQLLNLYMASYGCCVGEGG